MSRCKPERGLEPIFTFSNDTAVDRLFAEWQVRGLTLI